MTTAELLDHALNNSPRLRGPWWDLLAHYRRWRFKHKLRKFWAVEHEINRINAENWRRVFGEDK